MNEIKRDDDDEDDAPVPVTWTLNENQELLDPYGRTVARFLPEWEDLGHEIADYLTSTTTT